MKIDKVSESGSHLKDIFALYEKVKEFDSVKLHYEYNSLDGKHNHYVKEDIDHVLGTFNEIFSLSPDVLASLKEAMKSGIIDFTMLPAGDVPAFATPVMDQELTQLLYIISRRYFRSIRESLEIDNIYWEEGRCPVCNAVPALSIIDEGDKRRYHCSFCGTRGYYKRIGCPYCYNENPDLIDIMYIEKDEDIRIDVCNKCKSYVKSIDASSLSLKDIEELDLISLPLDIVAQNKQYIRRSPNPIGITQFV